MKDKDAPAERTDWKRIGLIATVLLVPGGFLLGGVLAARRMRAAVEKDDIDAEEAPLEPDRKD